MPKIECICAICHKVFLVWPYRLQNGRPYCSRACGYTTRHGKPSPTRADLVGQVFNLLTVLSPVGMHKGHMRWLCRCRCGKTTVLTTGVLRSGATRSCGCLERRLGPAHPNWRKGYHINEDGYREVSCRKAGSNHRYCKEHRVVFEAILGRPLRPDEIVHHLNGDKLDNRPANLVLVSRAEHQRLHASASGGL
jgi:hypothetical protein